MAPVQHPSGQKESGEQNMGALMVAAYKGIREVHKMISLGIFQKF